MTITPPHKLIEDRIAAIFNEWAQRYAEDPDAFGDVLDADGKPIADYGQCCSKYFFKIGTDLGFDQPETQTHPDDLAVDSFALAMKAKLAASRSKGRHGWNDPDLCTCDHLIDLLLEHLLKGNPGTFEDIANFCMMLHQRNESPLSLAIAATCRTPHFRPLPAKVGETMDDYQARQAVTATKYLERRIEEIASAYCQAKADHLAALHELQDLKGELAARREQEGAVK